LGCGPPADLLADPPPAQTSEEPKLTVLARISTAIAQYLPQPSATTGLKSRARPGVRTPCEPPPLRAWRAQAGRQGKAALAAGEGRSFASLPRSSDPGANCHSIAGFPMPLPPEPMTAASSRAVRQQTFRLARASSRVRTHREPCCEPCSPEGSAEPRPGARARLPRQCQERVAPFHMSPGRCSLNRDKRDGCPSRSSRYTGVGALPFSHHEGLDGTTTDRAMLTIASVFAALAQTLIHDRVQAGLARARAKAASPSVRRGARHPRGAGSRQRGRVSRTALVPVPPSR
jgi:hypothetical protein